MKLNFTGKFVRYNPNTRNLTIEFDPLDPSIQANIEALVENHDKFFNMSIDYNVKFTLKDSLRRAWYGSIATILQHSRITPDAEATAHLDNELRESIFPAKIVIKDGEQIADVKRMREMTADELKTCIEILHDRYDKIKF